MEARFWLRLDGAGAAPREVGIPAAGLLVGRRSDAGLCLSDPSVSGRHAELVHDACGVLVRDLGSTNGTRVDGERVREKRLNPGDELRFGAIVAHFCASDDADETQAAKPHAALATERSVAEISAPARAAPVPASAAPAARVRAAAPAEPAAGTKPSANESGASGDLELEFEGEATQFTPTASDSVGQLRVEHLGKRGARSAWLVLTAVLLALGAAGWWFFLRPGEDAGRGRAAARRAVQPIAGNLLPGAASFEGEDAASAWEGELAAPATFATGSAWAHSGASGLGVELAGGEWALLRSPAVPLRAGSTLLARASASATGGARAWIGIELVQSAGGSLCAWSQGASESEEVQLELAAPSLPGCAQARLVLLARADADAGSAGFDDAGLTSTPSALAPAARSGPWELHLLGAPPRSAALVSIDALVLSGLELEAARGASSGPRPDALASCAVSESASGLRLGFDAPAAAQEPAHVRAVLAREALAKLATLGEAGFQPRRGPFEAEGVASLSWGTGLAQARLLWPRAVALSAQQSPAGGLELRAPWSTADGALELELQLSFKAERARALEHAQAARAAEARAAIGESLAAWQALLDEAPFEEALVAEAEAARARLLQAGMDEVAELASEAERARFFALSGLARELDARARALQQRYANSPVAAAAAELARGLSADVERDEQQRRAQSAERARALLRALADRPAPLLEQELQRALRAAAHTSESAPESPQ
jgi:hypothetical protein